MRVILDLPDELMKEVKLHALDENQRLKDAVADLLRKGLAAGEPAAPERLLGSLLKKDRKTGLPVVECRKAAARETSPNHAAEILME